MSASTLPQARFDTSGLDQREAEQAYLDRLDGILDTEFLQPFSATLTAYRLGPLSVLSLLASARRSIRKAERIGRDRYESIGVQYVVAGYASGNADGRLVASDPGSIMILDYARPFTITDHGRRDVLNIAVPRSLVGRVAGERHGAILSGPAAELLAAFMKGLHAALPSLPASAGGPLADAFIAMLAAVLADDDGPSRIDAAEALILRAEHLVDAWIGSPELGPVWLAAKLNVSRSELYATLERFGGVARFIMQRRLDGARAALENTADGRQIRAIAYAFGFTSEAHFARAFRASFGATASDVRRSARERVLEQVD